MAGGLGSFMGGFVGGAEVRHKWDDRKYQRTLDEEDRTYKKEDRATAAEERARRMAREDLQWKDEDQKRADDKADREAAAAAYAAAAGEGSADTAPADSSTGLSLADATERPANAPALGFGAGIPAMPQPGFAPGVPVPAAPAPVTPPTAAGAPPVSGPLTVAQYNSLPPELKQMASESGDLSRAINASVEPGGNFNTTPTAPGEAPGAMGSDGAKAAWASNEPARLAAEDAAARGLPADTRTSIAAVADPGATPSQAAANSDPASADPSKAPAVQIAAATMPAPAKSRLAFGIDTPIKVSPAKAKEATASFLDNYLKVGAPVMIEHFLKTGQIDKAKAFGEWVKDAGNQKKMEMWAAGVHAAAIGDEEGMMQNLGDYYNSFDDGLTLVRDDSHIVRDDKGNMIGATLTFKDDKTGETHTQTFHGAEDLMQQGVYALSPEKMFEVMYEQAGKADAARLAADKAGGGKTTQERIASAMVELGKTKIGFADLPPEQQVQMAVQFLQTADAATGAYTMGGAPGAAPQGADTWLRRPAN